MARRKKYGFVRLMLDMFLICITGGGWLVWIAVKYLRNGHR